MTGNNNKKNNRMAKRITALTIGALMTLAPISDVFAADFSQIDDKLQDNTLMIGEYVFELGENNNGYDLNHFMDAVKSIEKNSDGTITNEAYYKFGNKWYNLLDINDKDADTIDGKYKTAAINKEKVLNLINMKDADNFVIDFIKNEIEELPSREDITLDNKATVEKARTDYNNLTEEQKELIKDITKLINAEEKIAELSVQTIEGAKASGQFNTFIASDIKGVTLTNEKGKSIFDLTKADEDTLNAEAAKQKPSEKNEGTLWADLTFNVPEGAAKAVAYQDEEQTYIGDANNNYVIYVPIGETVSNEKTTTYKAYSQDKAYEYKIFWKDDNDKIIKVQKLIVEVKISEGVIDESLPEECYIDGGEYTGENIDFNVKSTSNTNPSLLGPESGNATINADIIVNAGEDNFATLRNVTVNGNIIIEGKDGNGGSVTLDNVKVVKKDEDKIGLNSGKIIVKEIAEHSLNLDNGVEADELLVEDKNGSNIVVENANLGEVIIKDDGDKENKATASLELSDDASIGELLVETEDVDIKDNTTDDNGLTNVIEFVQGDGVDLANIKTDSNSDLKEIRDNVNDEDKFKEKLNEINNLYKSSNGITETALHNYVNNKMRILIENIADMGLTFKDDNDKEIKFVLCEEYKNFSVEDRNRVAGHVNASIRDSYNGEIKELSELEKIFRDQVSFVVREGELRKLFGREEKGVIDISSKTVGNELKEMFMLKEGEEIKDYYTVEPKGVTGDFVQFYHGKFYLMKNFALSDDVEYIYCSTKFLAGCSENIPEVLKCDGSNTTLNFKFDGVTGLQKDISFMDMAKTESGYKINVEAKGFGEGIINDLSFKLGDRELTVEKKSALDTNNGYKSYILNVQTEIDADDDGILTASFVENGNIYKYIKRIDVEKAELEKLYEFKILEGVEYGYLKIKALEKANDYSEDNKRYILNVELQSINDNSKWKYNYENCYLAATARKVSCGGNTEEPAVEVGRVEMLENEDCTILQIPLAIKREPEEDEEWILELKDWAEEINVYSKVILIDFSDAVSDIEESAAPEVDTITVANNNGEIKDTVEVTKLVEGDVVKVYDAAAAGKELGIATVAQGETKAKITLDADLGNQSGSVWITVTSPDKTESIRVEKDFDAEEIEIVLDSKIEQDPGKTGGKVTVTVEGEEKTITFDGEIAYYKADESVGRTAGNRVGVQVTAPTSMKNVKDIATLEIGDKTYAPQDNWMDGENYFWYYPKVTKAGQEFTFVIKWDGTDVTADTFTIKISDNATMEAAPAVETKSKVERTSTGGTDSTFDAEILTFGGTIDYYLKDSSSEGNPPSEGNYVGVKITAPQDVTVDKANATFKYTNQAGEEKILVNGTTKWLDGENYVYYYPKVTNDRKLFIVVIDWDGSGTEYAEESITIKVADNAILKSDIDESEAPEVDTITVVNNNGETKDTVEVTELVEGDVVKVYDAAAAGKELGTATVAQGETKAKITLDADLGNQSGSVWITVTSADKTESIRVEKEFDAEETALVLDSKIEQDPGKTGGNATVTVEGKIITFDGEIAYYKADESVGRTAGNRVGVQVTSPTSMKNVIDTATLTIEDKTYAPQDNWMDGDNYFWYYPKVTKAGQEFPFVVKWDGTDVTADTFTIKISDNAIMETAPAVETVETEETEETEKVEDVEQN